MSTYPHHERLHIENFTVFENATFAFVPGINVFVGENGTGKTHLLKLLFAFQWAAFRRRESFIWTLDSVFQVEQVDELFRQATIPIQASHIQVDWNGKTYAHVITQERFPTFTGEEFTRPIYIPAIDMMGHTQGFLATYDEWRIDFDLTHRDIVTLLLSPERREKSDTNGTEPLLASLLGGELEIEGERFFLKTSQGRQPMPLVAEGLRKIATLYQLLRNGHLRPGSVLFWDEPEVNLNPLLMDEVVHALLSLARNGVQIFIATHSYVLLKELDLQTESEDAVRFFALEMTKNGSVPHATEEYLQLSPNPIAAQFDTIYDREVMRSLRSHRR